MFSQKKRSRPKSVGGTYSLGRFGTFDGGSANNHIGLPMANAPKFPTLLFNKETDRRGFMLDFTCMF